MNLQRKKGELYLEKAACLDFDWGRPHGQTFVFWGESAKSVSFSE